jgi:translation initiation factor 6
MGVAKLSIGGNSFIGAFAIATDSFALIGKNATAKQVEMIKENLNVDSLGISIDGSDLVGIYAVANSKSLLLPDITNDDEVAYIKKALPHINVQKIRTSLNALGNNILANDRIAVVNSEYDTSEIKEIESALGVEVIKLNAGGFHTVGASNILTNKGIVLNNRATDHDFDAIKPFVKNYSQSTANLGSLSIRLSTISNSNGLLVGDDTTGFEMARITEGLGL